MWRSSCNRAKMAPPSEFAQIVAMATITDLHISIQEAPKGLTLADLLGRHPDIARRTAQRWIGQLVKDRQITASGEGRARRYLALGSAVPPPTANPDTFPAYIPLSADSRDIVSYIDQALEARKPVGYQRDFLDS